MDQLSQCLRKFLLPIIIAAIVFALLCIVSAGVAGAFGAVGTASAMAAIEAAILPILLAACFFLAAGILVAVAACVWQSIQAQHAAQAVPTARPRCPICNFVGLGGSFAGVLALSVLTTLLILHR